MPLICAHGAETFVVQALNDWGPRSTPNDPNARRQYWTTEQPLFGCENNHVTFAEQQDGQWYLIV